mmetsp:Transcript_31903/g.101578  ORF Transcript_31903/g.101578 Transcript_31903/m.101578 type:complete len:208 (+) Transcript_31903:2786-3409(+)
MLWNSGHRQLVQKGFRRVLLLMAAGASSTVTGSVLGRLNSSFFAVTRIMGSSMSAGAGLSTLPCTVPPARLPLRSSCSCACSCWSCASRCASSSPSSWSIIMGPASDMVESPLRRHGTPYTRIARSAGEKETETLRRRSKKEKKKKERKKESKEEQKVVKKIHAPRSSTPHRLARSLARSPAVRRPLRRAEGGRRRPREEPWGGGLV